VRMALGRAAPGEVSRSAHGVFETSAGRADPIAML
jgi:hypothetical protein